MTWSDITGGGDKMSIEKDELTDNEFILGQTVYAVIRKIRSVVKGKICKVTLSDHDRLYDIKVDMYSKKLMLVSGDDIFSVFDSAVVSARENWRG